MTATLQDSANDKAHLNEKLPNGDSGTTPLRIRRAHIGVWDFYEETYEGLPSKSLLTSASQHFSTIREDLPFVARMVHEVFNIPGCAWLAFWYVLIKVAKSLIPAVTIW